MTTARNDLLGSLHSSSICCRLSMKSGKYTMQCKWDNNWRRYKKTPRQVQKYGCVHIRTTSTKIQHPNRSKRPFSLLFGVLCIQWVVTSEEQSDQQVLSIPISISHISIFNKTPDPSDTGSLQPVSLGPVVIITRGFQNYLYTRISWIFIAASV